jgi:hypothetical protein
MVDNLRRPRTPPDTDRQATLREWARKHYLRDHMREDALPADEFRLLDERLVRWTADQHRAGKLPPDYELSAKSDALAKEFVNNRDEAKPIFTVEEQRDVDASRAASSLRERIDDRQDLGAALRQESVQYAIANALGELDARKRVSDRFGEFYGKSPGDYAKDQRREPTREPAQKDMRVVPAELGWDKYEPALQRWAAYNSMQYVARRDGAIDAKEYAAREEYLDRWVEDQRRQGKLPPEDEVRSKRVQIHELMLPYQKHITREDKQKMRGDGAYRRRVEDYADQIKSSIETERQYTRLLKDCAMAGAFAYDKSLDQAKADIEERFTRRYLYTPSEYYQCRVETSDRDQPQSPDKQPDRTGNPEYKSRSGKSREADDDRGR